MTDKPESDLSSSEALTDVKAHKKDISKKLTQWLLIIAALYFVWYIIGDRITPMTDQARVRTLVIPIVPQVSGLITQVHIGGDKPVKKGSILFEIDDTDYVIAVEQAKAKLTIAGQDVGANTAAVAAAKAALASAKSDLATKQVEAERIFAIEKDGIISKSQADRTRGAIRQAELAVDNAKADYAQAQQMMGEAGENNPIIQSALADLSQAELNLSRTKVYAPTDGVVSNAKVYFGLYAQAGQQIMSFISTDHIWVEASYRENNLGNIKVGDSADILLDSVPGTLYKGSVSNIGYAVDFGQEQTGALANAQKPTGWMRDPQRFNVVIKFNPNTQLKQRREGGQADVIVYTGDHFLFNALGKLWAWLTSILSYVH